MIIEGKFYVEPPKSDTKFKELLKDQFSAGAGQAVDNAGLPSGPWTPDKLADAISNLEANGKSVELRTVQLWFQSNDKGISPDNLRWIARIFGCEDPDKTVEWQKALSRSYRKFISERAEKRKTRTGTGLATKEVTPDVRAQHTNISKPKRRNLAITIEQLFTARSPLDLPIIVWTVCLTVGLLSAIFGVNSVTYSPIPELNKQVGYFWGPNWTLLSLVMLPLYLSIVSKSVFLWKAELRGNILKTSAQTLKTNTWEDKTLIFSLLYWACLFICFGLVFILQWSGVHLKALSDGELGHLMIDWSTISIVSPDVISTNEALTLSFLGFFQTGLNLFLFFSGLILICTMTNDLAETCSLIKTTGEQQNIEMQIACEQIAFSVYRATIVGLMMTICIKVQARYLISDAPNILAWFMRDISFATGNSDISNGLLEQRALANTTTAALLLSVCFVFSYTSLQVNNVTKQHQIYAQNRTSIPWRRMIFVVMTLFTSFWLTGAINGFSLFLGFSTLLACYSLYDPLLVSKTSKFYNSIKKQPI